MQLDFLKWGWNTVAYVTSKSDSSEYLMARNFFIYAVMSKVHKLSHIVAVKTKCDLLGEANTLENNSIMLLFI